MILANLGVKPGSIVIETGTGTGSLSTSFISALQPMGRLYTFEYHDARAAGAASDFDRNGLSPWVTVTHRDTIATGFPYELDGQADAVFLDLPAPWDVVPAAKRALKNDAMFCSFSPCMEQIQATADRLRECEFVNIEMIECLQKAYDVRHVPIREDFEDWNIESPLNPFPHINTKKRSRQEPDLLKVDEQRQGEESKKVAKVAAKYRRSRGSKANNDDDDEGDAAEDTEMIMGSQSSKSVTGGPVALRSFGRDKAPVDVSEPSSFRLASRPFPEMRGHTGYLIFARKYALPSIHITTTSSSSSSTLSSAPQSSS